MRHRERGQRCLHLSGNQDSIHRGAGSLLPAHRVGFVHDLPEITAGIRVERIQNHRQQDHVTWTGGLLPNPMEVLPYACVRGLCGATEE